MKIALIIGASNGNFSSFVKYLFKMESFKKYNDLYLKNTEDISNRTISLPVHNFITNDDVYEVCDKIKDFSMQEADIEETVKGIYEKNCS